MATLGSTSVAVSKTSSGVDPAQTMSAYDKLKQGNRDAMKAMSAAVTGINDSADDMVAAYGDIAIAETAKAKADAGIKIGAIDNANKTLQAFQADVNMPDNLIMRNQVKVADAQNQKAALRPVLDEKLQTQIWDDPLQWAINQFELPTLKAQYNQAARAEQEGNRNISQIQQQVAAQQSIQPTMVGDAIKASAAADAAIKSNQALISAAKVNQEARQIEMNVAAQKAAMNGNEANFWLGVQKLNAEKETLAFNTKAMAREDEGLKEVNAKRVFMQMPEFSPAYWHTLTPAEKRPHLEGINTPAFAASPEDAFKMVQQNGFANLQKTDPTSYAFLTDQFGRKDPITNKKKVEEIEAEHVNDAKFRNMSSVDQQAFLFGKMLQKDQAELAANTDNYAKLSPGHFAQISPANVMILNETGKLPLKPDNLYVGMMKDHIIKNGPKPVSTEDFYQWTMAQAIADPKKIDKLAEDMSAFFEEGQKGTWAYGGGFKWGLPRPEKYILGGSWAESIGPATNGLFGMSSEHKDRPVNAWNATELKHAIVVRSAAERQRMQFQNTLVMGALGSNPLLPLPTP